MPNGKKEVDGNTKFHLGALDARVKNLEDTKEKIFDKLDAIHGDVSGLKENLCRDCPPMQAAEKLEERFDNLEKTPRSTKAYAAGFGGGVAAALQALTWAVAKIKGGGS